MAQRRAENEIRITPSVIDRLIDLEPDSKLEGAKSYTRSIADLKQSIRRDLDWLLNTRRSIVDVDPGLEETSKSLAVYGLPDFIGSPLSNTNEQRAFVKHVEDAIKFFAPQLIDLKISYEPPNSVDRSIAFRIEGRIDIEPTPEPVVFDTVLLLGSGEFGVKPA